MRTPDYLAFAPLRVRRTPVPSFPHVVQSLLLAPLLHAQATPPPLDAFGPRANGVVVRTDSEAGFFELRDARLCR